jgi:hypothetical protein
MQRVVNVLDVGQLVGFDRGQTIFEQNMEAYSFGIVCSGELFLSKFAFNSNAMFIKYITW